MSMDKKVPEIRFKGFGGEWDQRKLDTIFGKIRNAFVGTATPYYVKEGHFYLESNNVKDGKINRKNEIFINDEFYYKQSDKWLREGDIVMVQSGHVGHTAVIPPELNNIAAHALIMFTDPKEEISSHFLNFQFQTDKVKAKLSEITTGNTIKHILSSEMKEFEMFFSDYEEQTQIGNYFQKLDSLINQHQQKHDKLSSIKKAMLEKMFPKQGETIPEIRFKGFSGEWKDKQLDDLCSLITKQTGFDYSATIKPSLVRKKNSRTYSFIQNKDFSGPNINLETDFFIPCNIADKFPRILIDVPSVLISISGKIGNVGFYQLSEKSLVGGAVGICKLKCASDGLVIVHQLLSNIGQVCFQTLTKSSSHANITVEDIRLITVKLPSTIEEKNKIGKYFNQLDKLINQHQQQITKLNNIKQACLSKMFV